MTINSPYLTTDQSVEYLGGLIGRRQLERYRMRGSGPMFIKLGRRCVYTCESLDSWLRSRTFSSTAEAKRAGCV